MRQSPSASASWTEHLLFLGALLRNPRSIGAIAPSSPYLARHMVAGIGAAEHIIELGPGTGVFTRGIVNRVGPSGRVLAVDTNRSFIERLQRAWPEVDCVCASAETLPALAAARGMVRVDHIISGLPFATLPADTTRHILDGVHETLRIGGTFTTFQYVHAYGMAAAAGFRRELSARLGSEPHSHLVFRNLPPAFVLTWRRRT
jgi:phosphatidylethanolamine/phosphatidyl-N-methylethanolamine N-methyltransferase